MSADDKQGKERVWRLASDVVIKPVEEWPQELIEQAIPKGGIPEGHFGIERRRVRSLPKIVNKDVIDVLRAFGEEGATYKEVLEHFIDERDLKRVELHPNMEKMVKDFIKASFLVDAEDGGGKSAESIEPSFKEGDMWLSYKILENVHCIIDSEIYKVEDTSSGHLRALKITQEKFPHEDMKERMQERLKHEFAIIEKFNHPNIIKVWERGTNDCRAYGILDWVDGPAVRSYAYNFDELPSEKKLMDLSIQCLEALKTVHNAGYLHGDVHTGNFLIKDGNVCLIDFGLARPIKLDKEEESKYIEGGVLNYMPPEYVRQSLSGEKGLWGTVAGEIYSCGVMIYSLFTRKYPNKWTFYRKEYMKSILNDPPLSFEECELEPWQELECVLHKALAKNSEERFESLEEFMGAMEKVAVSDSAHNKFSKRDDRPD